MQTSPLAGSLLSLVLTSNALAQLTWTQLAGNAPADRYFHAMVYDSAQQRVLLFGGYTNPGPVGDTWQRSGGAWAQLASTLSPPARMRHAMAYDSGRGRAVLFGGLSSGSTGLLADTWEFDGSTNSWAQVLPATSPPYREGHAMAYDAARQRIVLFGGWNGSSALADTWEWTGSGWVAKFTLTYPSARTSSALAYDAARQRVVLFGGDGNPSFRGDTWEFDGLSWVQLNPTASPSPRLGHGMAYDQSMHRVVLFGGSNGPAIGGTWINGPMPALASAASYGAGCGAPPLVLSPDANGRPVLGQMASATIVDAPTPAAAMSIGWSNLSYGPFALPVTLAGIGMPGCDLWTSADVVSLGVAPLSPTTLRFALPVPNAQSLLGSAIYLQAYAYAPGANPLELVVSNGVAWTLGDI